MTVTNGSHRPQLQWKVIETKMATEVVTETLTHKVLLMMVTTISCILQLKGIVPKL